MAKNMEAAWDNKPGFDRVNGKFIKLDLDLWLKEQDILKEAEADGRQNKPAANEPLAGIPSKIITWVNQRGRICRQNVGGWLNDLERNLTDMEDHEGLKVQVDQVEETLNDAELDLEGKVREQRGRLAVQLDAVRQAKLDYEAFRSESGLRRLPDYSGRKTALRYIIFFFCLELILNATSLMDANPFGLVGAIVQMALICAVNILIMGWCMGGLLRLAHHVKPIKSWFFGFLACVVVVLVAGFNMAVGHFRDSMQAILDDPSADIFAVGSDTFVRFAEGPVAFDSFQSALLALLGFLFFCVSAWKWLSRDDRYPEYGQKHRQLQEIQDDYRTRFESAENQLNDVFKKYEAKLEDIRHKLRAQQTRWKEHRVKGNAVVADFSTNLKQYQHDLNQLLGAYISANLKARTEPPPAWFSETVEVDQEILVSPDFTVPEQTSLGDVAGRIDKAIKDLQKMFKEHRKEFPTLEEAMGYDAGATREAA